MTTPIKWGAEFSVNSAIGSQFQPEVVALANGRFVAAWINFNESTDEFEVKAQVFNADGSAFGNEFFASIASTSGSQSEPTLTGLADGSFVLAWTDVTGTDLGGGFSLSNFIVRSQVFAADGSRIGNEFAVNTSIASNNELPIFAEFGTSVTALADGRFVMAWTDIAGFGGDSLGFQVRAQMFNADGSKSGSDFLVNTTTAGSQTKPSITALAGSRFVVAWEDGSQSGGDTSGFAVRAQVFNSDGSKSGSEFLVNTSTASSQRDPSITALADGRFAVVWTDRSQHIGTLMVDIRVQAFNADGTPSGTELLVGTAKANDLIDPKITALADGRFVIVWRDDSETGDDTSSSAIRAQVFGADGAKSGAEFLVHTTTDGTQTDPSITALADGRLVVVWSNQISFSSDIFGQIFDPRTAAIQLDGTRAADDFHGTGFDDVLNGMSGKDKLSGGAGDDVLNGGRGSDTLVGGIGDDTFIIDNIRDVVIEEAGEGIDTVQSAVISLRIGNYAEVENAALTGKADLNLIGDSNGNILTGNGGANIIQGRSGDDTIFGNAGKDLLQGGVGNDVLAGGGGADTLEGGAGNDTLSGDSGNDILDGGAGDDVLTGGVGRDTFVFTASHDTARITDFEDGLDKIDLRSFGLATATAAKAFAVQDGADVVFTFAPGNVLTVDNMTIAQFTGADFILS